MTTHQNILSFLILKIKIFLRIIIIRGIELNHPHMEACQWQTWLFKSIICGIILEILHLLHWLHWVCLMEEWSVWISHGKHSWRGPLFLRSLVFLGLIEVWFWLDCRVVFKLNRGFVGQLGLWGSFWSETLMVRIYCDRFEVLHLVESAFV